MNKRGLSALAVLLLSRSFYGQQAEDLAGRAADYLRNFLKDQYSVSIAVTSLENRSALAAPAVERFYQLFYSHLPEFNNNQFLDLLIDFRNNQARFNLTGAHKLQYLVHLKLMQNGNKTGVGIAIFSRRLDRIAGIKYVEADIPNPEKTLLDIKDFGFKNLGFAKRSELEVKPNLLDVASADIAGTPTCFFLYPGEIQAYKILEQSLEKISEIKLKWGSPLYPTLHAEGKLGLFPLGATWLLAAGTNFSPQAKSFRFQAGTVWEEADAFPFVPFALVRINQKLYLAGSPYELGKNYFQGRLQFLPTDENSQEKQVIYEHKVPAFFSLGFVSSGQGLESVNLIDTSYQYCCYAGDFATAIVQLPQKGSALALLDNQWLAVSDYTSGKDRLFLFKIENGIPRLTYENPLEAEILFIASGYWQSEKGFWLYTRKAENEGMRFRLEFWSKGGE